MLANACVIHASGSTSFILALTIRLYMTAALCQPRSEPENSQDLPECDAAQRAFRGIIGQANTAIVEEPGKHRPSASACSPSPWQHRCRPKAFCVPHSSTRADRRLGTRGTIADRPTLLWAVSVDAALDIEQLIDTLNRFQTKRRQYRSLLALRLFLCSGFDVGLHKEFSARIGPTACASKIKPGLRPAS